MITGSLEPLVDQLNTSDIYICLKLKPADFLLDLHLASFLGELITYFFFIKGQKALFRELINRTKMHV